MRNVVGNAEQTVSAKLVAVADEFKKEMRASGQSALDTAKDVRESGRDIERSLTATGTDARGLADDVSSAGRRIDGDMVGVGQSADKAARGVKSAGGEIEREIGGWSSPVSGFQSALDSIDVGGLTTVLGGAGAVAGGLFAATFLEAVSRDAGTDKLGASLGLDEETSARLGRIAGDVYAAAWGESIEEVNTAVGGVWSTLGAQSDRDVQRLTESALTVADVFDVEVSRAISSAGILLSSGLVDSADEAFDLMTVGMQRMPMHLREELLEASDEYGQFFDALGFEGDRAFGVLVRGAEDGIFGIDKAGDAIKEFTIRATDMSTSSEEAFEAIGLDAGEMAAAILEGGDTAADAFDEIIEGLLSIEDPVARSNAAIALFGTPLEDLSVTEIPAFLESLGDIETGLGDVDGAVTNTADLAYDNLSTRWTDAWRTGQQSFLEFADEHVLPAVERIIQAFDEDGLAGAIEQVKEEWGRVWPQIRSWLVNDVQPALIEWGTDVGTGIAEGMWQAFIERFRVFDWPEPNGMGVSIPDPSNYLPSPNPYSPSRPRTSRGGTFDDFGGGLTMHAGGRIPGPQGAEVPFIGLAGEHVSTIADVNAGIAPPFASAGGGGGELRIVLELDSRQIAEVPAFIDALTGEMSRRGRDRAA